MRQMPERGPPPISLEEGADAATLKVVEQVLSGKTTISFSQLYGAQDVRQSLKRLQNGVCAYCEALIAPVCIGHIEHFRPKGAVRNEVTGKVERPGYYWLAYEWSNLMLACEMCNIVIKGSRFPLLSEASRARNHEESLSGEVGVLIDPFLEDPRRFIRFRRSVAVSVDNDERGERVIEILDLNRNELERARRLRLQEIRALGFMMVYDSKEEARNEAASTYEEYTSEAGAFSSCVRDAMRERGSGSQSRE